MAVETTKSEKKQVPLWVVALAGVALLAFVIWWGARSFGPREYPKTSQQIEREAGWEALVKKAGGDISKLSDEERKKFFSETGPGANSIWQSYSRKLGFQK